MRRIMVLFTIVVLMTTMLAVAAGPASAQFITRQDCLENKDEVSALFGNLGKCIKQSDKK